MPLILKEVLSKKNHVELPRRKKNTCREIGLKKIHPLKSFYPPPVISNGPPFRTMAAMRTCGLFATSNLDMHSIFNWPNNMFFDSVAASLAVSNEGRVTFC